MEPVDGPLLVQQDATTAILTINRPEARNAADASVLRRLIEALAVATADESVRSVVITGAGDRAFCAGADIRHMQTMDQQAARRWALLGHDAFQTIEDCPKPVIAAINGVAAGGGCELALACDYRIAAETAHLGQPEVKLGLIPGWGGTQRLPRLVGLAAAIDLILTGRLVTAADAWKLGMVTAVVPGDQVLPHALAYASQFASLPPVAVALAKRSIHLGRDMNLSEAQAVEVDLFAECFGTEDHAEGLAAFVAKRAPQFKGR
jgi:enoyl-CoA hydratase